MKAILVANPKGGAGKSTLATNLAGYFAHQGGQVMLGDVDRQQSARAWLGVRPAAVPPIASWDIRDGQPARPPAGTTHVVLDTPAGLHGKLLDRVLKPVRRVIVPVQPSLFDILATRQFLETLLAEKVVRKDKTFVAVVACASMPAPVRRRNSNVSSLSTTCRSSLTCAIPRPMCRPRRTD